MIKFDLVRLAELRDSHAQLVLDYQSSLRAVSHAALEASRARLDAPSIVPPPPAARPTPRTNEFYMLPLDVLQAVTPAQLEEAGVNHREIAKIIVAESRLSKARAAHATKALCVRTSADGMARINIFAQEQQL